MVFAYSSSEVNRVLRRPHGAVHHVALAVFEQFTIGIVLEPCFLPTFGGGGAGWLTVDTTWSGVFLILLHHVTYQRDERHLTFSRGIFGEGELVGFGVEGGIIELTVGQWVFGQVVNLLLVEFFVGGSIHVLTHLDIAFHIFATINVAAAGVAHSKAVEVILAIGTLGHLPFGSNTIVVENGREEVVNGVSFKVVSAQFRFRVHTCRIYGNIAGGGAILCYSNFFGFGIERNSVVACNGKFDVTTGLHTVVSR